MSFFWEWNRERPEQDRLIELLLTEKTWQIVPTTDGFSLDVASEKPAMSVVDKTFTSGGIGIGTFDDTARFGAVYVYDRAFNGHLMEGERSQSPSS